MTQTLIDPRMFDTGTALPAMDGSSLTSLPLVWNLISKQDPSAASAVEFTGLTTYEMMLCVGQVRASAAVALNVQGSVDNGSTYGSTNYQGYWSGINRAGTNQDNNVSNGSNGIIHAAQEGGSTYDTGFSMIITGGSTTSGGINFQTTGLANVLMQTGGFTWEHPSANDMDAFKIYPASGTITGTIALFGAVSI